MGSHCCDESQGNPYLWSCHVAKRGTWCGPSDCAQQGTVCTDAMVGRYTKCCGGSFIKPDNSSVSFTCGLRSIGYICRSDAVLENEEEQRLNDTEDETQTIVRLGTPRNN